MARIFMTGATGFIGRALVLKLRGDGHDIVAWLHSVEHRPRLGAEVEVLNPDATDEALSRVLERCDAVVNLAGAPIGGKRWTADRKRVVRESRTVPTRMVVEALAAEGGPRVLVNASAVGFYGPTGDRVADESSPAGSDFLADTCVAWEREAVRARDHGVRVVLLRTGIVLAGDGGALPRMALPVKLFAGGPIGGGRQWVPWIHIDDEVGLILFALDRPEVEGPLNASAPDPVRQRDLVTAIGAALGRPTVLPTPALPLRLAMGEMATLALDGQRAVPRAALAAGYRFAHTDVTAATRDVLRG